MSKLSKIAQVATLVVAGACASGAAFADKGGHGHGHGHGHGKGDDERVVVYNDGPAGCPPGLAKKHNGCLPPGQAKKLMRGQRLPSDIVYYPVQGPVVYRLPPLQPGYQYVRVGNDIVLLRPGGIVVNIFANLG
jgi:Ni/Co efflux regulator RcnB